MLDVHKVEPFQLPVAIKAELRTYQQEGVNWLAFLNKYHLHGILCDGKRLKCIHEGMYETNDLLSRHGSWQNAANDMYYRQRPSYACGRLPEDPISRVKTCSVAHYLSIDIVRSLATRDQSICALLIIPRICGEPGRTPQNSKSVGQYRYCDHVL